MRIRIILFTAALTAFACGRQAAESPAAATSPGTQRQDSLRLEKADAASGLSGTFEKNGVVLRFMALRRERAQDSLAGDPSAEPYIVSVTIENGRGELLVSTGDPGPSAPDSTPLAPERREVELRMVLALGDAIQVRTLPSALEPERRALVQAAQGTAAGSGRPPQPVSP